MLLDPGCHSKHVWIENNVFRREPDFVDENVIGSTADGVFTGQAVCLAIFIKGHNDDRGTMLHANFRLINKLSPASLEADRVDDRFALQALQSRLNNFPF